MTPQDFSFFSDLLKKRSGLMLTPDKAYLLAARLTPLSQKWNFSSLEAMAVAVRMTQKEDLLREITEAMTTNESFFFRDQEQFQTLRLKILPQLLASRAGTKRIRIWSAASSSGQEAYSIAMTCAEEVRLMGWSIEIVGTDISSEMVRRAEEGVYTQFEAQRGMPIAMLAKYLAQVPVNKWRIQDALRKNIRFRQSNLLDDLTSLGIFDIIFCRNVLIYFDPATKTKVFNTLQKALAPDGALFLGGAETVLGITDKFRSVEGARGLCVLATAEKLPPLAALAQSLPPQRRSAQ